MNKDYGFIAADGNVLRTTDGGENWEIIPAGDYRPLYCVDIIDSLHIAAAGYGGPSYSAKNLYSSDGGYTWIPGGNLTTEEVNCIQYVNPDTGYLVMSGVSARKTTNRGQEWTTLQGISDNYEIQILYNNIGYSAGTEVKICKAEGDLDEWHRLFINDNFSDVFFVNEQKGFVISSASNSNYRGLYKTTNGGDNWESVPEAPDGVDLLFIDSLTGFLGAGNSIYKTTDGGDNWYPIQGTNGAGKIFFIDHTTGWAIHSNVIYKTTDKGENWLVQFNAPSSTSFRSIYFVDSLYGWTANSSRPYKTTDGGHNWIQQTNLDIWQSQDVLFSSLMTGYLLESNKLYRTTNGGSTFNLVTGVTGYSVAGKFSNYIDSTFFITGYETFRSLDGGENWYMFPELDLIRINGLHLLNPGSGYSAGETGLILRYYDTLYTPVELSSFLAKSEGQKVQLTWTTATETNNKGFEVQKKSFGNKWDPIGYVNGIGTTTIPHSYSYTDEIDNPGNYCYRLKQIDFDGSFEYSKEIEVNIASPNRFSLEQNYPNPFNPATTIKYAIPKTVNVELKVFDILGREVKTLVNETKDPGYYEVQFNAGNFASGIYFYRLKPGDTLKPAGCCC